MAKPSTQVLLMQAQRRIKELEFEVANARLVSTRFCADAACIAAHDVFQRTGDIMSDFMVRYLETVTEIAKLMIEDSETQIKDGKYLEYGKHKVDEAVRAAMTDRYFIPWDERHHIAGDKK